MSNPQTLTQLIEVIASITGNDPETIKPESNLEDDLGVVLDDDFERLIAGVNQTFDIRLKTDEIGEISKSVEDLANIIDEELELG